MTVLRRPSELIKSSSRGNVFCCREHYYLFNAGTKRTRKRNNMVCDECGVSFPRHASGVRGEHVYCTVLCAAQARDGGNFRASHLGETRQIATGYVNVKTETGWRPEHRVVMEEILGRHLRPSENVHHVNGDKADNRPRNLELWVKSQPAGQRPVDLVAWAREILDLYAAEVA